MLRITQTKNASGAAKYFDEGLQRADYFATKEKTIGEWGGKGAEILGLQGEVKRDDFVNLCNNRKPDGTRLNPRDSATRKVGYDFTFSVPKSVSLVYTVTGDERIIKAFHESVNETMKEIEKEMRTQSGQGKNKTYPLTQNMVWGKFLHKTSRPVDGISHPHLHQHVFCFQSTFDKNKERFQAGEFGIIKNKAPYYEAAFDARLAHKLQHDLGYGIDQRGYSWELTGIESPTLKKFSRRTSQIEELARKEKEQSGSLTAKQKSQLGALSRAKKLAGQSWEKLQKVWRSWLDKKELRSIENADKNLASEKKKIAAGQAVNLAVDHLFERKSVVKKYQIQTEAIKRGFGSLLPEDINHAMEQKKFIQEERRYMNYVTTEEAVKIENKMIAYVREGKGTQKPINPSYQPKADFLNDEQKNAIHHALNDVNNVTIVSGGAGVGKTTLTSEIRIGTEKKGIKFNGFAPSSAATDVLKKEGFKNAETVARLLVDSKCQEKCKNGVIFIDEAGLLGNKDMMKIMEIAKKQNARILLSGDAKQHSSIMAGDSLRTLEREANVKIARVNKIQRQRNSPLFKKVVALTSQGKIDTALYQLDKLGGVKEIEDREKRNTELINDYQQAVKDKKTALIVSPTHAEGEQITTALREKLQTEGLLENKERTFTQLKSTHWTEENKGDVKHYHESPTPLSVEFHQNSKGITKGERFDISHRQKLTSNDLKVTSGKAEKELSLSHSKRFSVYQKHKISVAKG